jgi:DNA-binding PadR family transcriptional regulator
MKERQAIAPDTYTKARLKAYRISDKGREVKKRYNISDKGRETIKNHNTSDKRREARKHYQTSDKGRETRKRYETSDKGREAYKRYKTSDKGRETIKRHQTSDKYKETKRRYRERLKDPRQQKARLEHQIHRENEEYRQKRQVLDHQKALQRADALVQVYNELSALVEAFPSSPHQQELELMPPEHAWLLEEESHDEAFEASERFQELHNHLRSLLEPSPSVSHPQELRPTEPAATQPSAFERLMTDYDHVSEQLEVYLQEFAAPESWLLRNTLDF